MPGQLKRGGFKEYIAAPVLTVTTVTESTKCFLNEVWPVIRVGQCRKDRCLTRGWIPCTLLVPPRANRCLPRANGETISSWTGKPTIQSSVCVCIWLPFLTGLLFIFVKYVSRWILLDSSGVGCHACLR